MTHKNPLFLRLLAAVAAAALLVACGGSRSSYTADSAMATAEMAPNEMASYDMAGGVQSTLTPEKNTEQKIIYTARVRMESTDFTGAADALHAAVAEAGAYFETTDLSGEAEVGHRSANYTVRVPVEHYSSFLAAVGEAGNVLSLSESAEDITASYLDTEARLNALHAQRDRLNALADQAETTADLLEIESQLSDVQYQIESYTSQKRYMDSQVSYSTVNISLREVVTLTPVNTSFGEQIGDAFTGGWKAFADLLRGLVLAVVFLAPVLICAAVIALIVLYATRKRRAARKAEREARREALRQAKTAAVVKEAPDDAPTTPVYKQ